jgi:nucleoside-diphosphate-sugar epimerase
MKIGIIGSSSQVGASVAYYLKKYTEIEVICFVRSSYSKILFDVLGITTDYLDLHNKDELKQKLSDCNTVIDFTYPAGEIFSIPKSIDIVMGNIISALPKETVYIYMSSIMAYGMPPMEKNIKSYFVPHSSYAFIKRRAEKKCRSMGKKYGVKTYNFRLGQVHGFLQSVNSSFREKLNQNDIAFIDGDEYDLTNTIFINSIAEAIIKFSKADEAPGTYTLISNPQWTLGQLYNYYKEFYNIPTTLKFIPKRDSSKNILNSLKKYRPILETYILMNMPALSLSIKGKYRENEIRQIRNSKYQNFTYLDYNLLGKPDRKIINDINSDYNTVFNLEKEMEKSYENMLNSRRV